LVPILVATALAKARAQAICWPVAMLALLSSLAIQVGANLVNDAVDFKKGADGQDRLGPRRLAQSGAFTPGQVLRAGTLCFFAAALLGLPLVRRGGWPIAAIGLASIACGYLYTMSPFALAYQGLGDLFVVAFFGLVAVGGLFYLQTGGCSAPPLLAGLQVGMLAAVLLAVNNLRDIDGDRRAGKRTLAVRFGARFARGEILFMALAPFALNTFWAARGLRLASLLPLLALPLGLRLIRNVYRFEPSPVFNRFLGQAASLHFLFGALLSLGLALAR
jgi:1,4-dihydroxy-2-naphthoate octaprenyltransferase